MKYTEDTRLLEKYSSVTNKWISQRIAKDINQPYDEVAYPVSELTKVLLIRKDFPVCNGMDQQIEYILKCFEFQVVQNIFERMGYKYANNTNFIGYVPTVDYLKEKARKMLVDVWNHCETPNESTTATSTGRFIAERYIGNGYPLLRLMFVPEEWGVSYEERAIDLDMS